MSIISCKCPSCREEISFDDDRSTIFCTYCGSKYSIDEIQAFEEGKNDSEDDEDNIPEFVPPKRTDYTAANDIVQSSSESFFEKVKSYVKTNAPIVALVGVIALLVIGVIVNTITHASGPKEAPVINVVLPIEASECAGKYYGDIETQLRASGFNNIRIEAIEDLKPSDIDFVGQIETVTVDGQTDFQKSQTYENNVEIIIRYHEYEDCKVNVHINFIPNLLFNKYDVVIKFGNLNAGTLEHGKDGTIDVAVKPGKYIVSFIDKDDSSVKGEATIEVDGEINVSYKISCYGKDVSVDTEYEEHIGAMATDEVMMTSDESVFKYKNYKDVETELKKIGFSKIKYNILYDIVWGITEVGEVSSVSIADSTSYKRGDIFSNNSEVIITYHMKTEDDPNRVVESKESQTTKSNVTVNNNNDFAALMKLKDATDAKTIKKYVDKLTGEDIELDCEVIFMMNHGTYKTRFDVCLGQADADGYLQGPLFEYIDVNYYDMHVSGSDTVSGGMTFHIVATVLGFDEEGCCVKLDPVSMRYIK